MRFQIAYFVIFGALALGGVLLSCQIAYRGLDLIERSRKAFGSGLVLLDTVSAPIFAGLLPALGFRLTFEDGRSCLLNILG